jgi:thiamine-phosphate pyrophosphorylase
MDLGARRRERLAAAHLYLVCDHAPGGRGLSDLLEAAIAGGVDIVQLRDKVLDDEALLTVARRARELCERLGALFILNDRPLVAREAAADGVHVGPDMLIGLSTHAPEEIDSADPALVDYIGVGPVHATPTKPGRPAVGLELVRYAAAHARVTFFAIGGLDARNVDEAISAGAHRVCVLRAIADTESPEHAARELRKRLGARPLES